VKISGCTPVLVLYCEFIAKLGEYLDGREGFEFIDMRGIGEWGEMHLKRWTPEQLAATGYTDTKYIAAYRRMIDAHAQAFPHSQVFLNVGGPKFLTIMDYAALCGCNFRQDGLTPTGASYDVGDVLDYPATYFLVDLQRRGFVGRQMARPALWAQRYQPLSTTLWFRLKDLFRLINLGSESFGIPKNELYVPAYNGGLFDPVRHPELEKWVIGDSYLAEAIDLLSRSSVNSAKLDFVDYSTLEIRHLGSIYEGLLEYRLKVAQEDMVVKGEEWVSLDEYNKNRAVRNSRSIW